MKSTPKYLFQAYNRLAMLAESNGKLKVGLKGNAILNNPRFNKGTAFTRKERDEFVLRGRLPFA